VALEPTGGSLLSCWLGVIHTHSLRLSQALKCLAQLVRILRHCTTAKGVRAGLLVSGSVMTRHPAQGDAIPATVESRAVQCKAASTGRLGCCHAVTDAAMHDFGGQDSHQSANHMRATQYPEAPLTLPFDATTKPLRQRAQRDLVRHSRQRESLRRHSLIFLHCTSVCAGGARGAWVGSLPCLSRLACRWCCEIQVRP